MYLNFGDTIVRNNKNTWRWTESSILPYYFSIYALSLVPLFALYFFKPKENAFLRDKRFWLLCLFAILLFTFRSSWWFYFDQVLTKNWSKDSLTEEATLRVVFILTKGAIIIIPLLIYWYLTDREDQPFYGMQKKNLNLRPYLILLLLLIPFVAIASQDASFLRKYPKVQVIDAINLFDPSMSNWILAYESLYILDFYVIELFFRGFMILAFVKFCGPKSILPVAVFYCAIHFNKPFPEALSSFFGGTILGIITYYSRSIWGGIIIHMGIAAVMEVGAYFGHYLNR